MAECTFRGIPLEEDLNHYRIGPLSLASELELPELEVMAPSPLLPVVHVRCGRAPVALSAPRTSDPSGEASRTEFLLRIPDLATYYVHDGVEIIVEAADGAPGVDLRSFLLGNVFAAVCHQRGLLPLHASAIGTPRGAVAFLGRSGAGKSSLAAFLAQRGHPVLADDICLIDPLAPLASRVLPVAPWLKLWQTTLDALGRPSAGLPRTFLDEDKYRCALPADQPATRLSELILLDTSEESTAARAGLPRFERLAPADAIRSVLELTYQWWMVHATGQAAEYFLRCGQALEGVRVYRMYRRWGFDAMGETLDGLETHLKSEGP